MSLKPAAKAAANKKRYEQKKLEQEEIAAIKEQDTTGIRFKSEVRSYTNLCSLFHGITPGVEEEIPEKKGPGRPAGTSKKGVLKPSSARILGEKRSFGAWLDLRDKARKDLFWLGRDILKRDLLPHVHQLVCDMFVQKNFDGKFPEGFTLGDVHKAIDSQVRFDDNGEPTKEMMLLDPRGFYKSTIDGIDCVQWLLNCPDIRILILTGEYKLAVSFMTEIKQYFYLADGAYPTDLHLLFPEYVVRGVDGTSKEPLETPARIIPQRFPSLWVNSIDANLSGWHCDVRKGDDVVTDRNCNTLETRQTLKEKFDGTDNLLDEWGFSDYIGTRYWVDDYYGTRLKPDEETGEVAPIKYLCRQCWTVLPEYQDVPLKKLTPTMVKLAFPEKATWGSLRKKLLKNERSFRNQQLNEPSDPGEDSAFKITFDEDILRSHLTQLSAAPKQGDIFITWDWAPSSNKYSDMSVGCAARVYKKFAVGRDEGVTQDVYALSVLEIIYGRWRPSELAFQMVNFNKKWNPKQTLIEKSSGAELLQLEISRQAMLYATTLNVYWKPLDMRPDAKRNRIKSLETLLMDDRLYFVLGPWVDEAFRQLILYTGERKNRGRKDDIPDCMSFLSYFLPTTESNEVLKVMQETQRTTASLRENYNRIFGSQPVNLTQPAEPVPQPSTDPRNRFFGNNGLHI